MKEYCLLFGQEFKVPNAKLGWLPKILYRCADQLAAMLTYSSCVMVIRFDLRMNGYSENNKAMTTFWRRFGKKLKRKYAALKIGHLWVREQSKAKQQHYHVIVIVDKNIIHYSGTVTDAVIEVWNGMTGGQAHIPKNCYYVIKPNNWPLFEKVFKRVSYLAKVNTKGYRPAQTKDFGSSRLKKRLIKT
ncbi:YagK/YfjJ domain-containing protein [Shewanella sp. HL-SH8]|uniref:YagK/YfjJ domain-containing protein n=1 Tax=Shewanella sp. HL-SH8 TaxID=3436242 RepID=UPI003EBA7442